MVPAAGHIISTGKDSTEIEEVGDGDLKCSKSERGGWDEVSKEVYG
jgi:hypothetical protein